MVLGGQRALAREYNRDTRKILGRGTRLTTSNVSTGTEVEVLRIDGVPTIAGRLYRVYCTTGMIFKSTVAGDTMEARLRYATGGESATITSTVIAFKAETARTASGSQATDGINALLVSPGDGVMSVLLSIVRTGGTGSCSFDAGANYPIQVAVEDIGVDPGNTGVNL